VCTVAIFPFFLLLKKQICLWIDRVKRIEFALLLLVLLQQQQLGVLYVAKAT
jgi:hypothetical protein